MQSSTKREFQTQVRYTFLSSYDRELSITDVDGDVLSIKGMSQEQATDLCGSYLSSLMAKDNLCLSSSERNTLRNLHEYLNKLFPAEVTA